MEPTSGDERAEILTGRANIARSRLVKALAALGQRRSQVLELKKHIEDDVRDHGQVAAIAAAACISGVAGFVIYRAATAKKRRPRERREMIRRLWTHPERIARSADTLLGRVARVLVAELVHLGLKRALAGGAREAPQAT